MNNLKGQIQSAEELVCIGHSVLNGSRHSIAAIYIMVSQVSLRLDTSRNELLIANTALSILACSIAFSAYITGNLTGLAFPSFIQVINK